MQTISQGTTGTIRCIVTGTPRPTITWSRARGELTANHNVGTVLRALGLAGFALYDNNNDDSDLNNN